jgi:signal transduction histidine kinase
MLSESADNELDEPARAGAALRVICDTARELTRAMDEIVWAVNPRHDTLEGLLNYLEKFAQDFLHTAGIRCRLDLPEKLPPWPLTAEVRHNLFLAFKEALNNAVRHAAASEVRVALTLETGALALAVEDNGCGFSPGASAGEGAADRFASGEGLENMRRRLAKVGGVCEINSAPGKGTRVVFRIKTRATP